MKEEILKTYHQENKIKNSNSSLIGSSLLIVATILPALDRILCWFIPSLDSDKDARGVYLSVNIWQGSLYLSAVFIAFASFFKPDKKIYYYPIVINTYSAIVYYAPIWGYNIKFLQLNSWLAALISILITFPIMRMLKRVRLLTLHEKTNDDFQSDLIHEIKKLNQENKRLKSHLKTPVAQNEKNGVSTFEKND